MTTINTRTLKGLQTERKTVNRTSLLTKYLEYADSKANEGIIWYLKVIIFIPCIFMVFSIIAMSMITTNYVWFIGVSMILFFANVIAHIGEAKSRIYIPLYHATILLLFSIPAIAYLLN